ncbi:hypothetical protein MRX96_044146 [Rhipicephalus microplus]
MKVYFDMAKERLDFLKSIVKIEHLVDDLSWHADVAWPQATQKLRAWQKAAPGHDATAKLDGPPWLKMAENGRLGSQVNDRHRCCLPRLCRRVQVLY